MTVSARVATPRAPDYGAVPNRVPLTVLLVGRDPGSRAIVRWGLARSLEASVIGETSEWREAPELNTDLRPDIVLLDAATVPEEYLAVVRAIKAARPETRVVVLTVPGEEIQTAAAAAAGADKAIDRETFLAVFRHPARASTDVGPGRPGRPLADRSPPRAARG